MDVTYSAGWKGESDAMIDQVSGHGIYIFTEDQVSLSFFCVSLDAPAGPLHALQAQSIQFTNQLTGQKASLNQPSVRPTLLRCNTLRAEPQQSSPCIEALCY